MSIDLSRLPSPDAIEALDFDTLKSAFLSRFLTAWDALREKVPTLPAYNVESLETDPAVVFAEAWSYLRLLDRARVNDAVRAVLAPLAKGADLDVVVAWMGVLRLTIVPATDASAAVMESDERLLWRYMLSFDRPSAGTAARYLYEALTAWPQMLHGAVVGRAIHGRRGDTDLVILGPGGRAPTAAELALVRAACLADGVKPEAVSLSVLAATRRVYDVSMHLYIPDGPDEATVRGEAEARVQAAAAERTLVGGQMPRDRLAGAAYGVSVTRMILAAPAEDIPPDPYTAPVLGDLVITSEVAS